ncbi:hypothetical protein C8Q74DRAFT_981623 [Fomes fomentarius]|nr:hypothetical protein C8Q74DRAFT_981623 [Fomes fomentarius]
MGWISSIYHADRPLVRRFMLSRVPVFVLSLCSLIQARSLRARQDDFQFVSSNVQPVQCAQYMSSWTGGVPPFKFQVTTSPSAFITVGMNTDDRDLVWAEPFPAGYTLLLSVTDDTGTTIRSTDDLVVQPGTDNNCLVTTRSPPPPHLVSSTLSPSSSSSSTPPVIPTFVLHSKTITTVEKSTSVVTVTTIPPTILPSSTRHTLTSISSSGTHSSSSSSSRSPSSSNTSITTSSLHSSSNRGSLIITSASVTFQTIQATSESRDAHTRNVASGVIKGLSIGAAVVLLLAIIALCYIVRLKRRQRARPDVQDDLCRNDARQVECSSPEDRSLASAILTGQYTPTSPGASSSTALIPGDQAMFGSRPGDINRRSIFQTTLLPTTRGLEPTHRVSNYVVPEDSSATSLSPDSPPHPVPSSTNMRTSASEPSYDDDESWRTARDGGVRIAGGPPEQDDNELPPPYQRF